MMNMMRRRLAALALLAMLACRRTAPETAFQTPWGHPDLQGVWTTATITPLERRAEHQGKEFLTPAEAAALIKKRETFFLDQFGPDADKTAGDQKVYQDEWTLGPSRRSSLVIDPPDGKIPFNAEGVKRLQAAIAGFKAGRADSPEDRDLGERCLLFPNTTAPMMPSGFYNDNFQILQTPNEVVFHIEMAHDTRLIPIDGRPSTGIPQWLGTSRGKWEGETLVVETNNFRVATWLTPVGGAVFGTPTTRVVERFTRVSADRIDFRATIEDPVQFSRPWTV